MLVVLILCIGTRTDAKESKPDAGSEVSFTESLGRIGVGMELFCSGTRLID